MLSATSTLDFIRLFCSRKVYILIPLTMAPSDEVAGLCSRFKVSSLLINPVIVSTITQLNFPCLHLS